MIDRQDIELAKKMAVLARSSPGAWSEFLEEFRKYADRVKDACVMSTPDLLQVNQGRARESAALHKTAAECVRVVDALASKMK